MTVAVANLNTGSDTFSQWVVRTNELAYAMSTYTMTVAANTIGGQTTGNAFVTGIVSANVFAASEMRGGTVATPAALVFSSNVVANGALLTVNANVVLSGANAHVTATTVTFAGTTVNFTANVTPTANGGVLGTALKRFDVYANSVTAVTANVTTANVTTLQHGTIADTIAFSNTNLGANITAYQVLWQLPRASYRSGRIQMRAKNYDANNYQTCDISYVHDDVDAAYSVYGVVYTGGSQLVEFDAIVNGANVDIRCLQASANCDVRGVAQLIK